MALSTSAVARQIARQKAMEKRIPKPACPHSPYQMLYTASVALCQDCGLTWSMRNRGWWVEIEEE